MMRRRLLGGWLVAMLALAGCGQDGGGLGGMSREQEQAVETVSSLTHWLGSVAGSFSRLADVPSLLPGLIGGVTGDCPRIRLSQRLTNLSVGFDYGAGCDSALVGDKLAAGNVQVGVDLVRLTGTVGFGDFRLAGRGVNGQLAIKPSSQRLTDLNTTISRLQVDGIGTFDGDFVLLLAGDGGMGMKDGEVRMSDIGGTSFAVSLEDLRFNPVRYGSALPYGGAVTFHMPVQILGLRSVPLTVRFDDQSPTSGRVRVNVGPLGPFTYQLKQAMP